MVRVLILGTGGMAANHASAFAAIPGVEVVAGVDTRPEQLAEFNATHDIPRGFASVDEALAWGQFDAVANTTPDGAHYPTTMPLLAAGKHVLCEKSITLNSEELEEAVQLAKEHHVVLAEAMTIYHMPIYKELKKRMDAGKFGELRVIQMNFGSYKEYDMQNRFFNPNLAGGNPAYILRNLFLINFLRELSMDSRLRGNDVGRVI